MKIKELFTVKRVIMAIAIIVIITVIAVPQYIVNSRNEAAKNLLRQIALAEMAIQNECAAGGCAPNYAYTDGEGETAEAAIQELAQGSSYYLSGSRSKYIFLPDGSVAFQIMRPRAKSGEPMHGFVAFAAHNSVGSTVYVYDNIGVAGVIEALENSEHGSITVTSSMPTLYCYKYDASTKAVEKKPNETKLGPDPKGEYPARMMVSVAAE